MNEAERILKAFAPEAIGAYCQNFRTNKLKENVSEFSKKTEVALQSIYNFEKGVNVSYNTFYEYVKRGFIEWMETE